MGIREDLVDGFADFERRSSKKTPSETKEKKPAKQPKPFKIRGAECASVSYWQSFESGMRVCSLDSVNLFRRRDFERFEKWLAKAKAWTLDRKKK